ncbi:hypothetical protein CMUS01_03715 [Colletotrichum musicola]|uniref:Uncharacterized protein n=1 Tax=Colletotrichum musicola TaxID=2175873 RepID=A0A8H6NR43_9PEZI|nr:hypothetical protein CMUS01_03715 [Colletotrichum musicola]
MDFTRHDISNDASTPRISLTMLEERQDDHKNGRVFVESDRLGDINVAVLEAVTADLVSDPARTLDALQPSLERISLDSTINCGSHVDQYSVQRSTHSTTLESWVTEAEESQPLSGKHAPSPAEGSHPPPNSSSNRLYWQTWWLEILSSLLALSCLVAMITILGIHQGQPLPKWPDIISINSLISILTAVFKASLIMPIAEGYAVWNSTTVRERWDYTRSAAFVAQKSPGLDIFRRSLSSFDFLSLFNDTYYDGTFGSTLKAFTVRCSLEPCVKTYHAEVLNSAYTEIECKAPGERFNDFALVTNSTVIDGLEHPCAEKPDQAPGTVWFGERDGSLGSSYPSGYYPKECVWAVGMTSWSGIDSVLQDVFIDELIKIPEDPDLGAVRGPFWLREMFAGGQGNLSTVEEVVRGVAQSVIATMRNMPFGGNSTRGGDIPAHLKYASGRAVVPDTCIDVLWGWLAYPLSLLVLQWIFLALVLLKGWKVRKAGQERMVWKSSPIPLLFHGLDEDLREKNGDLMSLRQMDSVSGTLKVQLAPAGGQKRKGWRLCES